MGDATAALACGIGALACATPAVARSGRGRAHVLSVRDSADVHPTGSDGDSRTLSGSATGTLRGKLRFTVELRSSAFSFGFTLYVNGGGVIRGHGSGTVHIGRGHYASFAGTGSVTGGSGRYRRASGTGRFYGSEDRISHTGTIQVLATLHY